MMAGGDCCHVEIGRGDGSCDNLEHNDDILGIHIVARQEQMPEKLQCQDSTNGYCDRGNGDGHNVSGPDKMEYVCSMGNKMHGACTSDSSTEVKSVSIPIGRADDEMVIMDSVMSNGDRINSLRSKMCGYAPAIISQNMFEVVDTNEECFSLGVIPQSCFAGDQAILPPLGATFCKLMRFESGDHLWNGLAINDVIVCASRYHEDLSGSVSADSLSSYVTDDDDDPSDEPSEDEQSDYESNDDDDASDDNNSFISLNGRRGPLKCFVPGRAPVCGSRRMRRRSARSVSLEDAAKIKVREPAPRGSIDEEETVERPPPLPPDRLQHHKLQGGVHSEKRPHHDADTRHGRHSETHHDRRRSSAIHHDRRRSSTIHHDRRRSSTIHHDRRPPEDHHHRSSEDHRRRSSVDPRHRSSEDHRRRHPSEDRHGRRQSTTGHGRRESTNSHGHRESTTGHGHRDSENVHGRRRLEGHLESGREH